MDAPRIGREGPHQPGRWARLRPVVEELLDLSPHERHERLVERLPDASDRVPLSSEVPLIAS